MKLTIQPHHYPPSLAFAGRRRTKTAGMAPAYTYNADTNTLTIVNQPSKFRRGLNLMGRRITQAGHMLVYGAFGTTLLDKAAGLLDKDISPLYQVLMFVVGAGVGLVTSIHLLKPSPRDPQAKGPQPVDEDEANQLIWDKRPELVDQRK